MWSQAADWIRQVHFLHPGWLWAFPLSLLTVGLLLRCRCLRELRLPPLFPMRACRHPQMSILRGLMQQRSRGQRKSWSGHWFSYAVFLLLMHLSLAHPYRLGRQLPAPPVYGDTLFIVDTSISMVLRDYLVAGKRTERMTILKSVLAHFIDQLQGNRIGLIVFSREPYTLAPLTSDYALLKSRIHRLQPAVLTGNSSNLGRALIYTLKQLQQPFLAERKPALVLISDINRSSRDIDPGAVAGYLHKQGYRLYTIGIGASSDEAREDDSRGLTYEPTSFSLLKTIAAEGGGRFYWADNAHGLRGAIRAVQESERRPSEASPRYLREPLYSWFLLAGLAWLMLIQLWHGRGRPA
ncbi:MAG TPA: VWA domain-containing protein [Thiolapillus brandeum]|uniref:VWA domain-containing protein n=1 Tax=Thiolapillus brandeum TaxID=1076588 RepID=A0A831RVK9_9GAMM|nr:VWA domain-containing protein [Thiolapillus brandeum]